MEQYLTIIPLLAAVTSIIYYSLSNKDDRYIHPARSFFLATVSSVVILYAYFLFLIISHQYQYTYVWSYSSNELSLPLLLSTAYAGQEGSFFLWVFFSALLSLALLKYSKSHHYESIVIPVILLFEVFVLAILTLRSPFAKVWESYANVPIGTQPQDGRGLNPLLQNFWIVIHPPILFLGFATAIIPFAYAVAGLIKRDYVNWMSYVQPWLIVNVLTLGAGIIIGGYWAYITLGWGGFWGWDPVENSSLIPWLFSAAALHTIIIGRKAKGLLKTSFILSILSFLLVLYSTFLTRSGILGDTSVHAFVDPGKSIYTLLLILIGVFLLLGFVPFIKRRTSIPSAGVSHNLLSRENALLVGAGSLSVLSLFVLIGTSSPIITGLLQRKPAAVDSSYYMTTSLPLGLLIIILIGLSQLLWWDKSRPPVSDSKGGRIGSSLGTKTFKQNIALPLASAIIAAIISVLLSVKDATVVLMISASAFAFTSHFIAFLRIVRGNPKYVGGPISHAGLALMFIGIVASTALESKTTVQLSQGRPVSVWGNELTYTGNTKVDGKNAFVVQVKTRNDVSNLKPIMYFSDYNQATMREPAIKRLLAYDLYISPLAIENSASSQMDGEGVSLVTLEKGKPTKLTDGTELKLIRFDMNTESHAAMEQGGSFGVACIINATKGGKSIQISPELNFADGKQSAVPAMAFGHMLIVMDMDVGMGGPNNNASVRLAVHSGNPTSMNRILTAEISRKPLINFLWAGTIFLFIGLSVSMYRRFTEKVARQPFSVEYQSNNSEDTKIEKTLFSERVFSDEPKHVVPFGAENTPEQTPSQEPSLPERKV
jgi:cytochrome c-type biogenesis protein CcmF